MTEGIVLDTSVVIAGERQRLPIEGIMRDVSARTGNAICILSSITAVEFSHGIARAHTLTQRAGRQTFYDELVRAVVIHPVTLEIAQLAGRIEGELAAAGNMIALADLLIGATALHLGYSVATLNVRHFERIPGLQVIAL